MTANNAALGFEQELWKAADLLGGDMGSAEHGKLIELAKQLRDAPKRGDSLGLTHDKLAFYDALADHGDVVSVMGDNILAQIAKDLVETIRNSVAIDWTQKASVRARMRVRVKRLLRKHRYSPDRQAAAVTTVIEPAKQVCREWAPA